MTEPGLGTDSATLAQSCRDKKAALIIGHPGHELRLFGWLSLARPTVSVITDGSGRTGRTRLPATTRLIDANGARLGPLCGRFTDAQIYELILRGEYSVFTDLVDEFAAHFVDERIDYVVCDALEGYNPTHDLCRLIVDCAVSLTKRRDRAILQLDFLLDGDPRECPDRLKHDSIRLSLDEATFAKKLCAAGAYRELRTDVGYAFSKFGTDAYRVECLRPACNLDYERLFCGERPYYERYGEKQVAAGYYKQVLRYREHFVPIAEALRIHAEARFEQGVR